MWPLTLHAVRDVGKCWRVLRKEAVVECMEWMVLAEVETACRQETPLQGQKMPDLEVELEHRVQRAENQKTENAARGELVRSQIELPLTPVDLQPSIIKNRIKITYQCILEQCA